MKRLNRDKVSYAMSSENAPAIEISPGEVLIVETQDCYSGQIRSSSDVFDRSKWYRVNPATGPIYVAGAEPGHILRVDIERIQTRDYGVMCVQEGSGALRDYVEGIETAILPIRDGAVYLRDDVPVPYRPMIGVIGVAPRRGSVPNGTPGEHGGNMDCKVIGEGASVYLPVYHQGALLALGDLHAVMGDGEVCICGAEVSGEVTVRTRLVAGAFPTPCVETGDTVAFLGASKSLDRCERLVLGKAHRFLVHSLGLSPNEAARVMSLVGDLQVNQVVDPLKGMRFTLPKSVLRAYGMGDRPAQVRSA